MKDEKYNLRLKISYIVCFLLLFFVCFLFLPSRAKAASLYLYPESQTVNIGDTFIQEVRIDVEEPINTVEVYITFPPDTLEVIDVSLGNSLITIVAQSPVIDQNIGSVMFAGGIPGGYTGKVSGDPGISNSLAKIVFRALIKGEAEVTVESNSKVLLNDGLGTEDSLKIEQARITILHKEPGEAGSDEWQEILQMDVIPPESFQPLIIQDALVFEGRHFLVFSTTDKQTGIDYYEVKQGKDNWQKAESPYSLTDQKLEGVIKVRAVDKAGNERVEIVVESIKGPLSYYWVILILIVIVIVIYLIILRKRKRRKYDNL